MKICLFFVLLSLTILEVSCQGNKEKFKPMVENIKKTVMAEVPDIKKIDTVYLLIKVMTPQEKLVIQGVEYMWASTEAKRNKNPDSSYYEYTGQRLITQAGKLDSTTFLYYIAASKVIFTYNNLQKGMIEKRMYFDKDLNVVPKYSIFQKIAKTDNLKTEPEPYVPFTPEDYAHFEKIRILKYY
jgi:hypothetical protein